MSKVIKTSSRKMKLALYLCLSAGMVSAMAMSVSATKKNLRVDKATGEKDNNAAPAFDDKKDQAQKKMEQESVAAFKEAYRVFMHPRCMNCHPKGDVPLQGDYSHLHAQGVKRGPDGKGLYALKCKNCHQDTHVAGDHMPPGHSGWHLPPANLKMIFEGKTPRQLAMHFKDPKFTGFKTLDKMIEHVEKEPLVINSWTYGTPPPLSHAVFVEKVKEWIAKGAAIPE